MKNNTKESNLSDNGALFYLFRCIDDPCVVAKLQGANNSCPKREQEVAGNLFL